MKSATSHSGILSVPAEVAETKYLWKYAEVHKITGLENELILTYVAFLSLFHFTWFGVFFLFFYFCG